MTVTLIPNYVGFVGLTLFLMILKEVMMMMTTSMIAPMMIMMILKTILGTLLVFGYCY